MTSQFLRLIVCLVGFAYSTNAAADIPSLKCGLKQNHTTCIEGPETRNINGVDIFRSCWHEKTEYVCIKPGIKDTCAAPIARGASLVGAKCVQGVTIDNAYYCITEQREYQTTTPGAAPAPVGNCSAQTYCLDGKCFDAGSTPDPDFAKAVTGMEVTREAGAYMDDSGITVFKGDDNRCAKNVLKNCCAANGGGVSGLVNAAVLVGGSAYMYDVLGGPRAIAFGFDPTTFALSMAVLVIQQMLSCKPNEQLLAVKRDKNLCIYVGDYCSKELNLLFTKICIERQETYCCYNGKLARIINAAYRAQFGASWGSPESPSCGGLTVSQFQSLNFAAIDMSEFYADIKPNLAAGYFTDTPPASNPTPPLPPPPIPAPPPSN